MRPINSIQYTKSIILLFVVSFFSTIILAQTAPPIQWQKTYGGTSPDYAEVVLNTPDGGYVVAGTAGSHDIDVVGNHGTNINAQDFWIVKLDSNGNIQWKKCYGSQWSEFVYSIAQARDGGYIVTGTTGGVGGDVTKFRTNPNYTSEDIWVIKISATGTLIWEKSYGGINSENTKKIVQVSDGGYVFMGTTYSNDDDVSGKHGPSTLPVVTGDIWVVKIDSLGTIKWQKCLGGSSGEIGWDMLLTSNDGLLVLGNAFSTDGDVNKLRDSNDVWVIQLDSTGNILWNKTYGGSRNDMGYSVIKNINGGGYVIAGETWSNNGDVSTARKGESDVWVLGIDDTGKVLWDKSFGGSRFEYAARILQTPDSGFVIGGITNSNDNDISVSKGNNDWWILRLDKMHNLKWEKSFGTLASDKFNGMTLANDGYVLVGYMADNSGDHLNYKGKQDWIIIKLKENFKGGTTSISANGVVADIKVYPSPTNGIVNIDLPKGYDKVQLKLYDMQGRLVKEVESEGLKRSVDLSGLSYGTYMIQVQYQDQLESFKVLYN
ncbi:MAG: T9SS type A sorting domain-containing protein [Flavipsychrobacter sp.]